MTGPIRTEAARLSRQTGPLADDPWAGGTAVPVPTVTVPAIVDPTFEPLLTALAALEAVVESVGHGALEAGDAARASGDLPSVVDAVGRLAEARRRLALTESILTVAAGRMVQEDGADREGVLPDGRQYKVRRGATRKAWDHDGWRTAVRRELCSGLSEQIVDAETGEQVDVPQLLAAVQAVHGSAAPKVTALRELGLTADDWCETIPGLWTVDLSQNEAQP